MTPEQKAELTGDIQRGDDSDHDRLAASGVLNKSTRITPAQRKLLVRIHRAKFKKHRLSGGEWVVARNLRKTGLLSEIYPLAILSAEGEKLIPVLLH